jgi:hypothetical protein
MSATPPSARPRRLYPVVAAALAVLALVIAVVALVGGDGDGERAPVGAGARAIDPLAYDPDLDADYVRRATAGYSHVLYAKSPGGVLATARRVERYRTLIGRAADESDGVVDADTLEAIVFLESGGRPDVIAGGSDPANAAGLTQIVAETGQSLLDMDIDLARSRRLTRRARREAARRHPRAARAALAARRSADPRFQPAAALAATVRYLQIARERFGRDDLAVASYHMGIGNLGGVIEAYGGDDRPSYVRLFFDTTPQRHASAWRQLASFGDDSSTYLWRVLAAREIMRLYRSDRAELDRLEDLQTNKASAEEVLHPQDGTDVYENPGDIEAAREDGKLEPLPPTAARLGFRIDRRMGELAPRLDQRPELYRALHPAALALARWMGTTLFDLSRGPPLTMSSAVRDQEYQDLLTQRNIEATADYSLHTTGHAFDVLRRYGSRRRAVMFQFLLDRLQALNLIAWVREPAAIHITAATDAQGLGQ